MDSSAVSSRAPDQPDKNQSGNQVVSAGEI